MPSDLHDPIDPGELRLERAKLAARIHDEVSNRLSLAARESQRQSREAPDEEQREAWLQVNEAISEAMRSLHELIGQLLDAKNGLVADPDGRTADADDGDGADGASADARSHHGSPSTEAFLGLLRQEAKDEHDRLSSLGFHGTMRVAGSLDRIPDAMTGDEILALLHELCANVDKHCTPEDSVYDLSVHASGECVEINEQCRWNAPQVNDQPPAADMTSHGTDGEDGPMGGHGLAAHRTIVRQLGGDMVWRSAQWQWNCYARIPV